MSAELVATIAVIAVAMVFDYTNGFHDAANAIATSVSTRALTPRIALVVAAMGNLLGSFLGAKVAKTVGSGLVSLPGGVASLGVVFAGVVGAIGWNLLTWYLGLPSSSSHALFGGLVGATLFAAGGVIHWATIGELVLLPMVLSPIVGFLLGALVMFVILWVRATFPRFRYDQLMRLGWKVFLPFSLFWLVLTAGVLTAFGWVPAR